VQHPHSGTRCPARNTPRKGKSVRHYCKSGEAALDRLPCGKRRVAADIKGNGYRGARGKGCSVRTAGVCLSVGRRSDPRELAGRTPFPDRDRRSPPWSRRPPSATHRQPPTVRRPPSTTLRQSPSDRRPPSATLRQSPSATALRLQHTCPQKRVADKCRYMRQFLFFMGGSFTPRKLGRSSLATPCLPRVGAWGMLWAVT
jgi:hypothetical protein